MKGAKEFEQRMNDKEFAKLFSNAETNEDIIRIAHEQGYEISKEDIKHFKMTDEMLESVAGGKHDTAGRDINRHTYIEVYANPNITTH